MSAPDRLFADARTLIELESITPNEGAVTDRLEALAREMGLPVASQEVAEGRRNLLAGRVDPSIIFCTHTDTVPPYIPFSEDATHLHGRGACDTKGISACFLEAGRRLLASGFDDFAFLWVVGEEVDNIGARRANEWVRTRHLVVGEPTGNRLALGHKGCLGARLRARGEEAHSAHPERGVSAIHLILDALSRARAVDFGVDPVLGASSLNVGRIEGGVAANVLAPEAEASVLVRVVSDLEDAERRLRAAIYDTAPATAERLDLEVHLRMDRCFTGTVDGFETTVVSYGTDLPFLRDVGRPYLLGPGDILDAHTPRERISRREMAEAVEIYVRLARSLASQPA